LNAREKRLLMMTGAVFLVLVLPLKVYPYAVELYKRERDKITQLHTDIDRYNKLADEAQFWQKQHTAALALRDKTNAALLEGSTRELASGKMQALLQQLARETKIQYQSLELDKYDRTGEWVLVTQVMRFSAKSESLFQFLKAINTAKKELVIIDLNISSYARKLTATIKITGFIRLLESEDEEETDDA